LSWGHDFVVVVLADGSDVVNYAAASIVVSDAIVSHVHYDLLLLLLSLIMMLLLLLFLMLLLVLMLLVLFCQTLL
jgi:hypothetical protein